MWSGPFQSFVSNLAKFSLSTTSGLHVVVNRIVHLESRCFLTVVFGTDLLKTVSDLAKCCERLFSTVVHFELFCAW